MNEHERMELWYDLERNREHMQMDGRHYVADGLLFQACEAQQREIYMLRELCKSMRWALVDHEDKVYLTALDKTLIDAGFDLQKLGIEVSE